MFNPDENTLGQTVANLVLTSKASSFVISTNVFISFLIGLLEEQK